MPAVTQAEYARLKNVSPAAISKAVKVGTVLLNKDGLIETEDADAVYTPGKNINAQYSTAKAVRETYLARITKIACQKAEGEVLNTEDVRHAMERLGEMLVRDIDQLQGFTDELVSIAIKDGTKGMRRRLKEISRGIRQTIADYLTLEAVGVDMDSPDDEAN